MSNGTSWPKEILKGMVEGNLDLDTIRQIQRQPKDEDRFEKLLEIEQERVPWNEKILVPLQEHLYVVQKGRERIVKCSCGHEFGDYHQNWKLGALVYERNAKDGDIYPVCRGVNQEWMILREFYCPGCATQLEVEAVPPGYPFVFNALPDIDGFYDKHPALRKKIGLP